MGKEFKEKQLKLPKSQQDVFDNERHFAPPALRPPPTVSKVKGRMPSDNIFASQITEVLKNSFENYNDTERGGYTGISPAYNTHNFLPRALSNSVKEREKVEAYIQYGYKATSQFLTDAEKERVTQEIRKFAVAKDSVVTYDACNGLYAYITDRQHDREIARLENSETKRVEKLVLSVPFPTLRKIVYGDAFVDEKGKFKHGLSEYMNKNVEPLLVGMLTQQRGVPYLASCRKNKKGETLNLFWRSPFLVDGVDSFGNIRLLLDADFFLVREGTNEEGGGYITNDIYVPVLKGIYPLMLYGRHLEVKKHGYGNADMSLPNAVTACQLYSLVNCAKIYQGMTGIQAYIDQTFNVKRVNVRIEQSGLTEIFSNIASKKKQGVYIDFKKAIERANTCGQYLYNAIKELRILSDLKREHHAHEIYLPARSKSLQFPTERTTTGVIVKCDSIRDFTFED